MVLEKIAATTALIAFAVIGIGLTTGCVYHLIDIWRKQC